jgi:hypothetical protein
MKYYLRPVFVLLALTFFATTSAQADSQEKMIIALKTSDFELMETDISELVIGEARTIETDSGKVIDILRTADGAEIYVDGELLEMDFDEEGLHEQHIVNRHVEIICDEDEECDENVFVLHGENLDGSHLLSPGDESFIIHEEIEIECTDDNGETSCTDKMVWMSDDEDIDIEDLHEMHINQEGHKVIIIKTEIDTDD